MKVVKFILLGVFALGFLCSCASYQSNMNANVPNVNDVPMSKDDMPPMNTGDIN